MARRPISLYLRDGAYYARAWDETASHYTGGKATGERKPGPAYARGMVMLEAGEFRIRAADPPVLAFLADYWRTTPKALAASYRAESLTFVEGHVAAFPGFKGLRLSKVRGFHLNRLRDFLQGDRELSPRMINRVLQAVTVPLRWGWKRGHLASDPTQQLEWFPEHGSERGILSIDELQKVIALDCRTKKRAHATVLVPDVRQRAAVLLAALAGLRRGEARALTWADVDLVAPALRISRAYTDGDGFKAPKAASSREVPICQALAAALAEVKAASPFRAPEDLVLYNVEQGLPMAEVTIRRGFELVLTAIGVTPKERTRRHLVYHGLRHFFVSMSRTVLPDFAVRRLSGHRTAAMLENYSHTDGVVDMAAARTAIDGRLRKPRT